MQGAKLSSPVQQALVLTPMSHSSLLPLHAHREFLQHLSRCEDTKSPSLSHLLEKWGRCPASEMLAGEQECPSLPTAQREDAQPLLMLCPGCS